MYAKLVTPEGTQVFPCTRIYDQGKRIFIEREGIPTMEIATTEYEWMSIYVLNGSGKTIDSFVYHK